MSHISTPTSRSSSLPSPAAERGLHTWLEWTLLWWWLLWWCGHNTWVKSGTNIQSAAVTCTSAKSSLLSRSHRPTPTIRYDITQPRHPYLDPKWGRGNRRYRGTKEHAGARRRTNTTTPQHFVLSDLWPISICYARHSAVVSSSSYLHHHRQLHVLKI